MDTDADGARDRRSPRARAIVAAIVALALTASAHRAADACTVTPRAAIALAPVASGWAVPLDIDGATAPFLFDTGAERSIVFEDMVTRLGVPRDPWVATTMRGVGGVVRRPNAVPRRLALAGVPLRRATIAGDASLVVVPGGIPGASGLLGQDLLAPFDLDIDGGRAVLRLNAVASCAGPLAPWPTPSDAIPAWRATRNVLLIPVDIDGVRLNALIDTGASTSLVTAAGMQRLGLSAALTNADPPTSLRGIGGVGTSTAAIRRHRFARVVIGSEERRDVAIEVGPVHLLRAIDLILGRDWIAGEHLWISFATNTVFRAR